MDRDQQIKMLRQMRFTLLEQQEQLKQTLAELADQANQLAKLLEFLVPTHVAQPITLPVPTTVGSLYYRDGLNTAPELDEEDEDDEEFACSKCGQQPAHALNCRTLQADQADQADKDDEFLAPSPASVEPVVSVCSAPGSVLVLPVVSGVVPAELTKPGKVYKSLKAPIKGESFAWNGEDYIVVTVVSVTGATGNFRAKRASQIKKPGKPFDFRWEKSLGFTLPTQGTNV